MDSTKTANEECQLSGMMCTMSITSVRRINYAATVNNNAHRDDTNVIVAIVCDLCSKVKTVGIADMCTSYICGDCEETLEISRDCYDNMKRCLQKCNLYPISSHADIVKTGVCDVQCKAVGHVVTIPMDRERLRNVGLAVDVLGVGLTCSLCRTNDTRSGSCENSHINSNKRVYHCSPSERLVEADVNESTVHEYEHSIKRHKNGVPPDDDLSHRPPYKVVVNSDETVYYARDNLAYSDVSDDSDCVQDAVQPHSDCPIESAVLKHVQEKQAVITCDSQSAPNVTYVPFVVKDIDERFAIIGSRCKPLRDRRYVFNVESVKSIRGMENLPEATLEALAKYGTFAVDSARILHRLLCDIKSPLNYSHENVERIMTVLTSLRQTSLSCMIGARSSNVIDAQNRVIEEIFKLPDSDYAEAEVALNDDGAIDVTAILMGIVMGRPMVIDSYPNDVAMSNDEEATNPEEWCSRYTVKCSSLLVESLKQYLACDAKYDFMSEYLNVKLRGVSDNDSSPIWCKVPISYVHNYIMSRTCFGLVVYKYLLMSCASIGDVEYDGTSYKDHMIFVKACSGNMSDETVTSSAIIRYCDKALVRYTIPNDVFCCDEMSNFIIKLKRLNASERVLPWSTTAARIHSEKCMTSLHPLIFIVIHLINNRIDSNVSSKKSISSIIKELRLAMVSAKCKVSNSVPHMKELIESNVAIISNHCKDDELKKLLHLVRDHQRKGNPAERRVYKLTCSVKSHTSGKNNKHKSKTDGNDADATLNSDCPLPKKKRRIVVS
ncbi:hypothetical protein [Heliothis virescens ascovirus 3g]|uniref:Uncharacterized protein n=1 Tax=Heliothis virescens ascovirus 3g TaxID=1246651 RepID=K4NVU1_9VIRU|nr:hypothetical protein F8204_gp026 [Heliothis virescens ascovirus 3g]AFV50278.1 hypothetical protein [Heliothis virescens ascovirus 3g]